MKKEVKLFDTDYVLWDQVDNSLYRDPYGKVVIFGTRYEAVKDCCPGEVVISCTDLPKQHQKVLLEQIKNQL